jgi:hypothetical protein
MSHAAAAAEAASYVCIYIYVLKRCIMPIFSRCEYCLSGLTHWSSFFPGPERCSGKDFSAIIIHCEGILIGRRDNAEIGARGADVDIINQADKIMHKGPLIPCLIDGDCGTLELLAKCSING